MQNIHHIGGVFSHHGNQKLNRHCSSNPCTENKIRPKVFIPTVEKTEKNKAQAFEIRQ
jgi:hypothetical protein